MGRLPNNFGAKHASKSDANSLDILKSYRRLAWGCDVHEKQMNRPLTVSLKNFAHVHKQAFRDDFGDGNNSSVCSYKLGILVDL